MAAKGVYVTLNPVNDALLARAESRLKAGVNRTADKSIARIRNLLVDLDPIREEGVSSTDQEHAAALEMAQIIRDDLTRRGWSPPMEADSGNGAHLLFPVDLPNTPENVQLIKSVLVALAARYADQLADRGLALDQAVFNPARLTKLYGTWARKGDNTKSRPHRLSAVIHEPERRPVPIELLRHLAATAPKSQPAAKTTAATNTGGQFDIEAYLSHYNVAVAGIKKHGDATLYLLQTCLFDDSHTRKEAYIGQSSAGELFYKCVHNSCQGRTWAEARKIISGNDKLGQFMPGGANKERASVFCTGVCGDLVGAIRDGNLSPEQKTYLINLISKKEDSSPPANLAADVKELVLSSSCRLASSDVVKELGLSSLSSNRKFNQNLSKIFERLVKDGYLERTERRGEFIVINRVAEEIPWQNSHPEPLKVQLPLDLHELVDIYAGNIVIVGGTYNAGKTCALLNVALLNRDDWPINYLSSEMTPEELAARLNNFVRYGSIPHINEWKKVNFRQRSENFHHVLDPNGLNVIDYLELTKEFYDVGGKIDKIFKALDKGIAVIAIQKAPDALLARGGAFTVERARLAVSIDFEKLKIIKAKNLKPGVKNPTNTVIEFEITDGGTRMGKK